MQLNKKLLLTILSVSSGSCLVGMDEGKYIPEPMVKLTDEQVRTVFLIPRTIETQAENLAFFARAKTDADRNTKGILQTAQWLVKQRKETADGHDWRVFVDKLTEQMEGQYTFGNRPANNRLRAAVEVVKDTLYGLQSGDDCSQALVDNILKEINNLDQK